MQRSIASAATAALCAGWLAFAVHPAAAQGQSPAQQPSASPPSTAQEPATKTAPTPKQLDKTAAAIKSLQSIRSEYAQKLAAAQPDQQEQIASEAHDAMKKAVTDQGLSVEQYNSIIKLAQNDPSIRAQIEQRLGAGEK